MILSGVDPALLDRITARTAELETYCNDSRVTVEVVADELDAGGRVSRSTFVRFLETKRRGTITGREVLLATEDGKDITAKKQRELGESKGASAPSPFNRQAREKYRFTSLPASNGSTAVRIAFEPLSPSTELMAGEATVDPETGEVLVMKMHPSKRPPLVDRVAIEVEFEAKTPVGRGVSKIIASGEGGFAFIRKRHRVVTTLSDYQPVH